LDRIASWSRESWGAYRHVETFVIFLLLLAAALIVLILNDRARAREDRVSREHPRYAEWKKLERRWDWFFASGFGISYVGVIVARYMPTLKLPFALAIPGAFLAWAFATISAWVFWQSERRGWRAYLSTVWGLLLGSLLLTGLYAYSIEPLMAGLNRMLWWVHVAVGMMLAPVFLRLSGFFELSDFWGRPGTR